MKTWQMIKALTENPRLKAKIKGSDPHGNTLEVFGQGIFFQGDTRPAYLSGHFLSQEWELIREPVSWQEAIQAWLEGTNPYSVRIDMGTYELSLGGLLLDYSISSVKEAFTKGKWYIEE